MKALRQCFFLLGLWLLVQPLLHAQNPYERLGVKSDPLTLSQGRYQEFFPNDTLVQIGSVIFNTITQEVVGFVEPDSSGLDFPVDVASRWLSPDPLAAKYPEMSPYVGMGNNPIIYIDPDGLEIIYVNADGTVVQFDEDGRPQNADEQMAALINKVSTLRENSATFNKMYRFLNRRQDVFVRVDDELLQRVAEEGGAIPQGLADIDTRNIYYGTESRLYAIPEEFFHIFQDDIYGEAREEQELEPEAKLFDKVVISEINENGIAEPSSFSGSQKKLQPLISYLNERGDIKRVEPEDNKAVKIYMGYLKSFEKFYRKTPDHPYHGEQRKQLPEAYNITAE